MKKIYQFKKKVSKGFTLLETLVAIFILTIAITATLNAAQLGLQSSFYARDQITAYYLAVEALEQVRNIRDTNYVAATTCSWLTGGDTDGCQNIPPECIRSDSNPVTCKIDVITDQTVPGISACSGDQCILKFDDAKGYNHVTGVDSKFIRTVDIEVKPTSPNEAVVVASVTWKSGPFTTRVLKIKQVLFDWNVR